MRYLGYVPEEDLPGLTAGATIFVYPSLYEGFGLPLGQAMAAGVPLVTSNVSSMPEVAGDAALLVDPRSPSEIAAAIERLLLSPDLRATLARNGIAPGAAVHLGSVRPPVARFLPRALSADSRPCVRRLRPRKRPATRRPVPPAPPVRAPARWRGCTARGACPGRGKCRSARAPALQLQDLGGCTWPGTPGRRPPGLRRSGGCPGRRSWPPRRPAA